MLGWCFIKENVLCRYKSLGCYCLMFLIDKPCYKRLIAEKSGNVSIQVTVWNLIGLDKSFLCHSSSCAGSSLAYNLSQQSLGQVTSSSQGWPIGTNSHANSHLIDNSGLITDTNLHISGNIPKSPPKIWKLTSYLYRIIQKIYFSSPFGLFLQDIDSKSLLYDLHAEIWSLDMETWTVLKMLKYAAPNFHFSLFPFFCSYCEINHRTFVCMRLVCTTKLLEQIGNGKNVLLCNMTEK